MALTEAWSCVHRKDGRISFEKLAAIYQDPLMMSHSVSHSLMAVTLHFLEQAVDLMKKQPGVLAPSLPSPAIIQKGLVALLHRVEIIPLHIAIRLLEHWSQHLSQFLLVRLSRIFEPLFSPTIIFAFSHKPLTDLALHLVRSSTHTTPSIAHPQRKASSLLLQSRSHVTFTVSPPIGCLVLTQLNLILYFIRLKRES